MISKHRFRPLGRTSIDQDQSAQSESHVVRMPGAAVVRLWILSVGCTLLGAAISWIAWQQVLFNRAQDPSFAVQALVQTGPEVEALPTAYLAEMLQLTTDQPANLYQLYLPALRSKLLRCPCIAQASLQRLGSNTLQVTYTARQPIARLADLQNSLLSADGALLPYQPFYRPRRLPTVLIGLQSQAVENLGKRVWGRSVPPEIQNLANQILTHPLWNELELTWLDLSQAFDPDYSRAEVIIRCQTQQQGHSFWVRLSPRMWEEGLSHLACLTAQTALLIDTEIADLRMSMVAILHPRQP
jgi:hypothetical protein